LLIAVGLNNHLVEWLEEALPEREHGRSIPLAELADGPDFIREHPDQYDDPELEAVFHRLVDKLELRSEAPRIASGACRFHANACRQRSSLTGRISCRA
jgi:hypothetical protein